MRRLLYPVCVVALLAIILSVAGEKKQSAASDPGAPAFTTVTEAAFSLRRSGAEDATSFLVGSFAAGRSDGKLAFDGAGQVRFVRKDLSYVPGSYSLMQSSDGAAVLLMELDGDEQLYSFSLASPEGGFVLRNANGGEETYLPVT